MTTRRQLLCLGGWTLLSGLPAAFAQQPTKDWRVGFLSPRGRPASLDADFLRAFLPRMRELGYVENKNLVMEWRFADNMLERLQGLAAELVRLQVDVLVTAGPQATSAARKATSAIPIVMVSGLDPVGAGVIKSLARPGGNITGFVNLTSDMGPKLLEMLIGIVPKLSRVAVLMNPANAIHPTLLKNIEDAAQKVGVKVLPVKAQGPEEIENAFSIMAKENTRALLVGLDSVFIQRRRHIAELAATNRLPSISTCREYVEDGGLMSYGQNLAQQYWRAASYVDKIFKGARPADLPVEQSTKFELIINRKTAKALGLTIPQSLLISADRVIE